MPSSEDVFVNSNPRLAGCHVWSCAFCCMPACWVWITCTSPLWLAPTDTSGELEGPEIIPQIIQLCESVLVSRLRKTTRALDSLSAQPAVIVGLQATCRLSNTARHLTSANTFSVLIDWFLHGRWCPCSVATCSRDVAVRPCNLAVSTHCTPGRANDSDQGCQRVARA